MTLLRRLSEFFAAFASFSELAPRDAARTVRRLAESESFGSLGFLMPFSRRCADANVRQVWREETASFAGGAVLTEEQRRLLADFAEQFGLTSLERFTAACRNYEALFASEAEKEKQSLEKTETLTAGAGVLGAALILIVCW